MDTSHAASFSDALKANRSRIGASVVALGVVLAGVFAPGAGPLIVLGIPLVLGCMPLVINSEALSAWVNRRQAGFERVRERGRAGGPFGRYFLRPLGAGSSALWQRTENIQSPHFRAGVRVLALAYFWAIMIALLAAAAYVIVGVIIAIFVLFAAFWLLSHFLGGSTPSISGSRMGAAFSSGFKDPDIMDRVGVKGKKVYAGTNWLNEELQGRVDDEGNIYKGTNWLNEEKIGRIDGDGNIYKGTSWLNEEKVGRIAEDGTLYTGTNWFTEEKTGRIDPDGAIYKGTNWFNEEEQGRTGE